MHRFAKSEGVDTCEVPNLPFVLFQAEKDHGTYLGQGLYNENSRHNGMAWEMSLKEGLVDADVLYADGPRAGLQFFYRVYEKKGPSVGNNGLNLLYRKAH